MRHKAFFAVCLLAGLSFTLSASLTGQNCDCISASYTQTSVANCPNVTPLVTQMWTVCGPPAIELQAFGDCWLDMECPPMLNNNPIKTWTQGQCKVEVEHQNRLANAFGCRNGNMSSLLKFCDDCEEEEPQCEVDCDNCTTSFCDGNGCCMEGTPILISNRGNRLALTNVALGVNFDLDSDGIAERMAWTAPGSDDAFLALDRNGNGRIDDGTELFGDFTPQPGNANRNGFKALALFDDPDEGGNGDGRIGPEDAIFPRLALWAELDHDGVSDAGEMRLLSSTRVRYLSLDYREARRTDQYGNHFKYIALVDMAGPGAKRKFAIDVVFTRE